VETCWIFRRLVVFRPLVLVTSYCVYIEVFLLEIRVTNQTHISLCSKYPSHREKRVIRQSMFDFMNHLLLMQYKSFSFNLFFFHL